ncbi:MAG: beta-galactosidase trimerization domain-containing protein, partial [Saprospiraceae bacterium]|nr:beta-galactosidase trimerization domain-containing protein [Saprospiraceae bacterium]
NCQENFKIYSGLNLPRPDTNSEAATKRLYYLRDPTYLKWSEWRIVRLRELWELWDVTMRNIKPESRFIPNGFPDRIVTGELSDIFFTDHQARRGLVAPYDNGRRAKELRATMGMKPLGGIFSIGTEEEYRWKDSVQNEAEIKIWVSECLANNMRPWWVKFGGIVYDKRWLPVVEDIYQFAFENEVYLRNTAPIANVAMVYSEQTNRRYGGEIWQEDFKQHADGMYHALIEARMPFEMVNDRLLDAEHLEPFQLLILPNIAALSDDQCAQLKAFTERGGSILATFETSLYDEKGVRRNDFGLSDVLGVSTSGKVEGPMKNSYLRLKADSDGKFHPVLEGLEDAYRMINGIHRVEVTPNTLFPSPITLIPTYPDLPMEHVYPRQPETDTRELYLRENGKSRIAYIPWDIDRAFWKILTVDHGQLLGNVIRWALNEQPVVEVDGVGVVDVTAWTQENSMTVHLVNLTNPMMLKGPFRELIPVGKQKVSVKLPAKVTVKSAKLLKAGTSVNYTINDDVLEAVVPSILDHEVVAIDF